MPNINAAHLLTSAKEQSAQMPLRENTYTYCTINTTVSAISKNATPSSNACKV